MRCFLIASIVAISAYVQQSTGRPRARDLGIAPGALTPGPLNAITDVDGVRVGQVTIVQEAFTQVRRLYLDAPAIAPDDAEPRFNGHSTGRWMANTLVVETVGVKTSSRFRNVPHSARMRITERMRLDNHEILENQVTIDDPEYLTKPWTWTWMYKRWPGYKIQEYVCEDNRYSEDPKLGYQRLRVQ